MAESTNPAERGPGRAKSSFLLWVAEGFGLGRIPFAPGTFGALGGLIWFAVLMLPSTPMVYVGGLIFGPLVSVVLGGITERRLGVKDPSSFVLDEIAAMPLCFAGWLWVLWLGNGEWMGLGHFFGWDGWWKTAGVFLGFRLFDVFKPWPIGWSQRLPGGWGVTVDDMLAAGYVNGLFLGIYWLAQGN